MTWKSGRRTCRALSKAQAEQLERNLQSLETQLHQREIIALQRADLETHLNQLNKSKHLTIYNCKVYKSSSSSGKLGSNNWALRQQYQNLSQDSDRLEQERAVLSAEAIERY